MKKRWGIFVLVLLCINVLSVTMSVDAAQKQLKAPLVTVSNVAATGKVKVTWKKVSGAKSYKVYRSADKGKTWKRLKTTSNLSMINTNAVAGKTYYYKVKAIASKASNDSKYSKVKSCICDLARPAIKVSTVCTTGKIEVSWKKVDKAVRYEVYRSKDGGKTWIRVQKTKNTSIEDNNVLTGKAYHYKVKAIASNANANSVFSAQKKIKCGYLANETKTVKYTKDDWTTIYEFPDSNTKAVLLPYMTKVEIGKAARVASTGTWTRVYYKGKLYYVWSVKGKNRFTTQKRNFKYETNTEIQRDIVELAVDIALNWKTVYAGQQSQGIKNPDGTYGFDCSGFVRYVHMKVMQEKVPAYWITSNFSKMTVFENIYNTGINGELNAMDVELAEIEPGDALFFYDDKGNLYHCGIYLGNKEYAHASSYGGDDCVIITPMKESYKAGSLKIRRFLPEEVVEANKKMVAVTGCKAYAEMDYQSDVLYRLAQGEEVTVMYTAHLKEYNRGNWAYIKNSDGEKAFVYLINLEEIIEQE